MYRVSFHLYRLMLDSWALGIGIAVISTSLSFFLLPSATLDDMAVRRTLGAWDDAWSLGYGAAGGFIIIGQMRLRPAMEAFGLTVLSSAFLVQAVIYITVLGSRVIATTFVYIALSVAAFVRSLVLADIITAKR